MKLTALLIALFALTFSTAQNTTIQPGETLVFTASYKMSGIMTDLAQVTMETSEVKTSSNTLLRLKCTAKTFTKWNTFFKIDDLYESYVSTKTLTPYLYKREINEGSYYKFMQYKYSPKTGNVQSLKRKRRKDGTFWEEKKKLTIGSSTRDLVSTIYHIRNLDIDKAPVGSSDNFKVLFDNTENSVTIKLLGKENINSALGTKECYKLAISLSGSDVLKGTNDNILWLTADDKKIPIKAKFKVAIGSGELRIKSATF